LGLCFDAATSAAIELRWRQRTLTAC
jgi:hypothetical protein